MAPKYNLNARTIVAPLAAFTMAGLLFVYSRSSIQAAKRNAQRHREADGGQINWNNENLRRHGQLERPVRQTPVNAKDKVSENEKRETEQERALRERKWKKDSS